MTWTDGPTEALDLGNEATMLLPVIRINPPESETTMLLPAIRPYPDERTQVMPAVRTNPPRHAAATEFPTSTYTTVNYAYPAAPVAPDVTGDYPDDPQTAIVQAADLAQASGAAGAAEGEQPSVARSSAIMAAGSLVSRVTGLLRTIAIGAAIGGGLVGNAYGLANNLPNMVYELLLGGVLGSVLVPYLTRARLQDPDRGEAYAQRLMTLTITFLAGATVLAVAAAPLLTSLFAITQRSHPNSQVQHLTTTLGYLILPEILFYGFAALAAAILNTRGHFAAPTWTPILNNIVVIATAGALIGMHARSTHLTSAEILVLGAGTTLGIVVQAIGLVPALRKVGFRFKPRFDWHKLQLRELGRASGWMLAYVLVTEVALVVGLIIMYAAGAKGAPGVAIYSNAYLIFMMAHGICAVSIMVAIMPRLSAAAAQGRLQDLATQMASGTRLSAVVLIPITAVYLTLGHPLAVTLFFWGTYTHAQAIQTGSVIALAGLGLVPYAISQMQLFAFYALREQKTAGLVSFPMAGLRIALDVLFYLVLPIAAVTASLMVANTVSYVLAAVIGYVLLQRKIGRLGLTEMFTALGRLAAAAIIAAIPTYLVVLAFQHYLGTGKVVSIVTLVVGGGVLLAVYVGAAIALKAKDITDVAAMVKSRLRR